MDTVEADIVVELQVLLLLSSPQQPLARPVFAAASAFQPETTELAANPLDVCDTLIADGLDSRLLVPRVLDDAVTATGRAAIVLYANRLSSSGMKRVARDGQAYDLFEFVDYYRPWPRALKRWWEAPPVAEVQDEREIAVEGMLRGRSSRASAAASGAPPVPDEDIFPDDDWSDPDPSDDSDWPDPLFVFYTLDADRYCEIHRNTVRSLRLGLGY